MNQDPGIFSASVITSNRLAVELRYTLIPYLYTLFHRVHISGGTVVRSMAHVFPSISECCSLDEQFFWGSSLLIAPVIYENHINKSLYLPRTERWFDYYTGQEQTTYDYITVPAPLDFIPLYLRGGAIIPHQQSAMNTVASRKKPLFLIVALDKNQYASGDLFWDDGESIDTYERFIYNYFIFNYESQRLTIEPWTYKYPQMGNEIKLEDIKIFGMNKEPTRILWNGQELKSTVQWTFDTTKNILHMTRLVLNVAKTHKFIFL
jgi:alpha-glucosidase (family GH31 glycosyl hydrolase)